MFLYSNKHIPYKKKFTCKLYALIRPVLYRELHTNSIKHMVFINVTLNIHPGRENFNLEVRILVLKKTATLGQLTTLVE
jgi:hypothetical protein